MPLALPIPGVVPPPVPPRARRTAPVAPAPRLGSRLPRSPGHRATQRRTICGLLPLEPPRFGCETAVTFPLPPMLKVGPTRRVRRVERRDTLTRDPAITMSVLQVILNSMTARPLHRVPSLLEDCAADAVCSWKLNVPLVVVRVP